MAVAAGIACIRLSLHAVVFKAFCPHHFDIAVLGLCSYSVDMLTETPSVALLLVSPPVVVDNEDVLLYIVFGPIFVCPPH